MEKYSLNFETNWDQFFIADKNYPEDIYNDAWLEEGEIKKMAAFNPNFLVIGTDTLRPIKAEINLLNTPSDKTAFGVYDHVVEGSVVTNSGGFKVVPCLELIEGTVAEITLPNGSYRVRVYSTYQNKLSERIVNSFYKIEIWPAPYADIRLIKQFIAYNIRLPK